MWLSTLVELSPNKSTKARDEAELIYMEPTVTESSVNTETKTTVSQFSKLL